MASRVQTIGGLEAVVVAQGAAGTLELAPAKAGVQYRIVGFMLSLNPAGTFKFTDARGDLCGALDLSNQAPAVMLPPEVGAARRGIFEADMGSAINLVTATGAGKGVVWISRSPDQ